MNQYFACLGCGAEIEIELDLIDGESQRLDVSCSECGRAHDIAARYNYAVNEFELEVSSKSDG
jgi:transcription elongation factor Elf1